MEKTIHAGLVICLFAATLSFGGMEPLAFAFVQILALLLCGLVLWDSKTYKTMKYLPWRLPALFFGYVAVQSIILNPNYHVAQDHLLRLLIYLSIFLITMHVGRDVRARHRLVIALILLGMFEAFYGLVQYLGGWQQIFTYVKVRHTNRASGTYVNANHFAGLLGMILPLAFALTLYRLDRIIQRVSSAMHRRKSLIQSERMAPFILLFFASLLLFVGILFSQSRMGIFSASAAIFAMGALWLGSSWRRPVAVVLLGSYLIGVILFGLWVGVEPILERYGALDSDYSSRLGIWKNTLSLIQEHPWVGTGSGTFYNAYQGYQTVFLALAVTHAHNDYLEIVAEWGLLGGGFLLVLIFMVFVRGIAAFYKTRGDRNRFMCLGCLGSIFSILLHSITDFNLYIPANAMVLAVVLGISLSGTLESAEENSKPSL